MTDEVEEEVTGWDHPPGKSCCGLRSVLGQWTFPAENDRTCSLESSAGLLRGCWLGGDKPRGGESRWETVATGQVRGDSGLDQDGHAGEKGTEGRYIQALGEHVLPSPFFCKTQAFKWKWTPTLFHSWKAKDCSSWARDRQTPVPLSLETEAMPFPLSFPLPWQEHQARRGAGASLTVTPNPWSEWMHLERKGRGALGWLLWDWGFIPNATRGAPWAGPSNFPMPLLPLW